MSEDESKMITFNHQGVTQFAKYVAHFTHSKSKLLFLPIDTTVYRALLSQETK